MMLQGSVGSILGQIACACRLSVGTLHSFLSISMKVFSWTIAFFLVPLLFLMSALHFTSVMRIYRIYRPRFYKSTTAATMVGGPKEFGGTKAFKPLVQRDVIVSFGPPKIIVLSLKFHHLSSPQNNCSVPSNSVSSRPPKSFVVPPK